MKIIPLKAFKDNYIWVLIDEQNAYAVDPGDSEPLLQFLHTEKLSLKAILLTHHHADHIGGVKDLLNYEPKLIVYGPHDSRMKPVTHPLKPGTTFSLASWQFIALGTPGHTNSHLSFYEKTQKLLFCGDTLFSAGCGRVFDGTMSELHHAIESIKALPDETKIYCAHEYTLQNLHFAARVEPDNQDIIAYIQFVNQNPLQCTLPSTIKMEKKINPFMRTNSISVQNYVVQQGGKTHNSLAIFTQLRQDKDNFNA